MNSKHSNEKELPVGHPQRAHMKNNESTNIACLQCDKRFTNGKEIQDHMKEHTGGNAGQEFKNPGVDKICRYFKNGFCRKGDQCLFKHTEGQTNFTPKCARGTGCFFLQQNRCHYFHPGVGVQMPRMQTESLQSECRYKEQCWNISTCSFFHSNSNQGFRFAQRQSRPPQGIRMNMWRDY